MEVPNLCVMLLLLHAQAGIAGAESIISPYIKHFEVLSYDTEDLHRRHVRARRATQPEDDTLQLNLTAFQRTFHLILRRDASVFSEGFTVESGNGSASVDLSHLYSGSLKGEPGSVCYGSVLEGQFEGTIRTGNRTYHIESAHRYTSSPTDRRSIIYREDAVVLPQRMPPSDGFCAAERLNLLSQSLRPVEEKTVSRPRRTIDKSKTSCLLHLHVDHLYYKKFKSVEAVVAQIASYLRAVNDVFDKAEFDGINLINFRVKNLNVMFQEDESDPLNPLYIGPEKLLSLFSENNWGNYCLSYLLTNRDYSGVLGLAWEGKAGNWGGICSQYTTLRNWAHVHPQHGAHHHSELRANPSPPPRRADRRSRTGPQPGISARRGRELRGPGVKRGQRPLPDVSSRHRRGAGKQRQILPVQHRTHQQHPEAEEGRLL
ncbi:Disintegrin and metalloproteinase domain-containing protein 10 [Oryzias melastigma]|uniref:Disintegrin and metalloproteinase domain-containing protein 10 n=1 Tax=Oryzias melastigma TaxID=30732 RepID=A0A834C7P0_ORYME|nr:Disintegrin and metalloproteinase domain-containing protein 10 [Oryzias melastigma]